ncbi:MAG: hypothetical protein PHU63_02425 [Candidatus ainarchaeum sp.]|nr:hypothetical protein [Candidatus ainarchaeum sp.]
MKKGQISIELMIIIGFILIFFIPLLLISYFQILELNEDLSNIQANVAVSRLVNTINSVGRMGSESSVIMDIYLPANSEITFKGYDKGGEILLTLEKTSGLSSIVGFTWFSINTDPTFSSLKGGSHYRFNITSIEDQVNVTLVN